MSRIPARSPLPQALLPAPGAYPKQVDPTTCGIAAIAVLAARAKADPAYLSRSREGIIRTQEELHALSARIGMPWPQALGTSPWAAARLARAATGLRHRIVLGASMRLRSDEALSRGRDVLVYTGGWGSALSGWIPRHVVLLLAHRSTGRYAVFEPSSGRVLMVDPAGFFSGDEASRAALGFWRRPLIALVPEKAR